MTNATQSIDQVRDVLRRVWGYDEFRPLQEASIECVLRGQDSLTVLPTGGGKSICYQAPALCREGLAVVVSPLISLMKDQVDALVGYGVPAAFVNSSQNESEKRQVATDIRSGKLKLLYIAPERLLTERTLDFLERVEISFFAIDEAHCISNWGHDFRPEYRGLKILKKRFPSASVHALTATASQPVRDDIANQLQLSKPEILVGNFDRPNLIYRMVRGSQRLLQVAEIVKKHPGESGIVYCISRKEVEKTAAYLSQIVGRALPYHAGMTDVERKANQDSFMKEQCDVIVATVAFGMGIDKSNVRYVIHAGMPKSIEHYQQESGRAGRDGLKSECVLIHTPGDAMTWRRIMEGESAAANEGAFKALDAISDFCNSVRCRHRSLVEYFGQTFAKPRCDACDVCLEEMEWVADPITVAQKILSCVVRLEERFGAAHTVKVLVGSREQKLLERGHDRLSTFGLLATEGPKAVRMWIEQLIDQQFLTRSGEYQVLALTESGRRLLRRDGEPKLSVLEAEAGRRKVAEESWDGVDRPLFEHLRTARAEMAVSRNLPAYMIFGDATLRELARSRPTTIGRFEKMPGVGQQKTKDFGELFTGLIAKFATANGLETDVTPSPTASPKAAPVVDDQIIKNTNSFLAFDHFRNGLSVEQVAEKIGRAKSTTASYLEDFIRNDQVTDPSPWVDEVTAKRIVDNVSLVADGKMSPLYTHFNGEISYESIRIVLACWKIRQQKITVADR